jgi:hypothetical protein
MHPPNPTLLRFLEMKASPPQIRPLEYPKLRDREVPGGQPAVTEGQGIYGMALYTSLGLGGALLEAQSVPGLLGLPAFVNLQVAFRL